MRSRDETARVQIQMQLVSAKMSLKSRFIRLESCIGRVIAGK